MQGCVSEDTAVSLRDKTGEVLEVTLAFFNVLLDADSSEADLGDYAILSRSGWTELLSVARRNLWEGEHLCHLRTRLGHISLTGEQELLVRRGVEDVVVRANTVTAGDALLMLERPKLGKNAPPIGEQLNFRILGVLSTTRSTSFGGYVYSLETGDGMFVANGFLVHGL
ncbi:MAG: Hint domain-containing protein [Firmicutes bacterium]|nr:Hint domain-containing protein [Bacillota bacterium]